jgi:hypothetical protein
MIDVEAFASRFRDDNRVDAEMWEHPALLDVPAYEGFARRYAGCTFESGLYRFHDAVSGPTLLPATKEAFPGLALRAVPFAFDWLGRQFAIDTARTEGPEQVVFLLEPGTGEALEIPLSFSAFHNELDQHREPALADAFFHEWSSANPGSVPIPFRSCVGYQVPLFLGGRDTIENLELTDLEVYWDLSAPVDRADSRTPAGYAGSIGQATPVVTAR